MKDRKLESSWRVSRELLEACWQMLPHANFNQCSAGRYREWLDANELGLAFDELELIGRESKAGADFWNTLAAAAGNMELAKHQARFAKRADECARPGNEDS